MIKTSSSSTLPLYRNANGCMFAFTCERGKRSAARFAWAAASRTCAYVTTLALANLTFPSIRKFGHWMSKKMLCDILRQKTFPDLSARKKKMKRLHRSLLLIMRPDAEVRVFTWGNVGVGTVELFLLVLSWKWNRCRLVTQLHLELFRWDG